MNEILSIKNGNVKTFEQAYHQWSDQIYAFIFRQCRSEEIADEVLQQVFVRLWEKRAGLSEEYPLHVLLFRMSRTIFIDELRKAARTRRCLDELQQKKVRDFMEDNFENRETLQLLSKAIENMPPIRKQVFLMSRTEHLSHQQIAEKLGISSKTVENHIGLALKYLRRFTLLMVLLTIY
ncbi:RNA polymerase sigma factor [Pedobacter africanus]|uniref:RNA polymerase sigma-70 factor (ECF subfamily) n=1 Tax=Pedobacter africanus TaxID=151894 RepID=A0ACC6L1N8_9SPHI|nr:RNA polymerase sigma-70 factor [Pedobacter africanus]MDR6785406.1 RNA polymerase sigma-70 factor (ECF subfamily) [Pedobacter africanus]